MPEVKRVNFGPTRPKVVLKSEPGTPVAVLFLSTVKSPYSTTLSLNNHLIMRKLRIASNNVLRNLMTLIFCDIFGKISPWNIS